MKRLFILVPTLVSLVFVSVLVDTSAEASPSCSNHVVRSGDVSWAFFAGHKINTTYTLCLTREAGAKTPKADSIRAVHLPHIAFPSRFPTGGGESLQVTQQPYLYTHSSKLWVFRYSVEQSVARTALSTTYLFELAVSANGAADICVLNPKKACNFDHPNVSASPGDGGFGGGGGGGGGGGSWRQH